MTVLVTGGMGYIGSHTCVELLEQGMDVVVIDNLVNSSEKAKERIEEITGKAMTFYKADVRDYIHVVDLARGHVAAISYMDSHPGELIFNLGTGRGCSVLELVHAFEKANKLTVPYKIVGRRAGDIDECYCSPEKSRRELGWTAQYNVEDMCRDSWHWQTMNPNGYRDE